MAVIQIGVLTPNAGELRCIRNALSAYSIQHSWADCHVATAQRPEELPPSDDPLDILICDMSNPGAVELIKRRKEHYPALLVFPVAGPEIPPTVYVCPEIMPCGLFWRPLSQGSVEPVVIQMMARIHGQTVPRGHNLFRISGKQKVQDIPYSSIVLFEARDKKLVLHLAEQELGFSGTLGQLAESLPPDFIRCHKSFLVNRSHILEVDRSRGMILMDNQMELPISRSYKKGFWEVYQNA